MVLKCNKKTFGLIEKCITPSSWASETSDYERARRVKFESNFFACKLFIMTLENWEK